MSCGPVGADLEQLGAAVEREQQPSRTVRARSQLAVDVPDVRTAHDHDVDTPARTAASTSARTAARIRGAIGNGGAVPVEDDRFESARDQIVDQDFDRRFTTCDVDPGKKIVSWPSSQRTR